MSLKHEALTNAIIGAAVEVHKTLGPGLLESVYELCLCRELSSRNIPYRRQVPVPLTYKGVRIDCDLQIDVLADEAVVIELKSIEKLAGIHEAQLLTYLKLSGKKVGLLINFNVELLKDGIVRRVA
jgi:GxxExxY protein